MRRQDPNQLVYWLRSKVLSREGSAQTSEFAPRLCSVRLAAVTHEPGLEFEPAAVVAVELVGLIDAVAQLFRKGLDLGDRDMCKLHRSLALCNSHRGRVLLHLVLPVWQAMHARLRGNIVIQN